MSPETTTSVEFEQALDHLGIASGQRCLLLVDAAQFEENAILQSLYALDESPTWCWLFEDSELATLAEAGPIVVDTAINSRFTQHAVNHWSSSGLLLLVADQQADILLVGLRASLTAHLQTFGPTVLRSYDTRFLQVMQACQPERVLALSGPDTTWLWSVDSPEKVSWAGRVSSGAIQPIAESHDREFERMLGWVAGWSACARAIPVGNTANAEYLTAFIAEQYRAGEIIPTDDGRLETLWQEYQQAKAPYIEPGNGCHYRSA